MTAGKVRMCNIYYILMLQIREEILDRGDKNRSGTDFSLFQFFFFLVHIEEDPGTRPFLDYDCLVLIMDLR